MPQDAFTIKFIAKELKDLLCGGKISKITQSDRDNLTFIIYTLKGTVKLDICLSARYCRISLTDCDKPVPASAPGFCMLLRKHLANAEITDVAQIPFERVVTIDFDCTSEFERLKMRLYVEIMGKYSNVVLTQNGLILGALKTTAIGENTKRVLFPGIKYSLPEPQDKISPDDLPALEQAFKNASGDMAKFISDRVKGVAYTTALDIAEIYKDRLSAKDVYQFICGENYYSPCVVFNGDEPIDFKAKCADKNIKTYSNVLEAQKNFYDFEYKRQIFADASKELLTALSSAEKKLEKRLQQINEKLMDCRGAESVKLKGELLTANIYAIKRGADSYEAVNYYDENCGTIKIQLDPLLSPSKNAQKYYKRYAKLKRTQEAVTAQKIETEERLDYLNSISAHVHAAENLSDLEETREELKKIGLLKESGQKKQKPKILPFRSYRICGFTVLSGRNNIQNDRLLKHAASNDLWLHTQGYHSSHIIIITEGRTVPDEVLLAAAEICAYYSDGRGGTKIPVDYTLRKYVKKPPAANAGFVIYSDYKTILVEPASLAEEISEEYQEKSYEKKERKR